MATAESIDYLQRSDADLIQAHLQAAHGGYPAGLNVTAPGRAMLAADPERRSALAARGLQLWISEQGRDAGRVASELLRANARDWTGARLVPVVAAAAALKREHAAFGGFNWFPHKPLMSAVEQAAAREGLAPELRAALERWQAAVAPRALTAVEERELGAAERLVAEEVESRPWSEFAEGYATIERLLRIRTPLTEERKLLERLARVLASGSEPRGGEAEVEIQIDASDAVGAAIAADRAAGGRAAGRAWAALLQHARTLSATAPSAKWSSEAARLAAALGAEAFGSCVADWINAAGKPEPEPRAFFGHAVDPTLLNDGSVELLKGLAWIIAAAGRAELAPALGTLAEACYKKVPNKGPRNVKVANAAVAALAALAKPEAAAQLARVRLRLKHASARAAVDKALAAVSQKTGLSPDDLAEMSVPAFGLDAEGVRRETVGDCTAELRVASSRQVELRWFAASDGKLCRTVPAAIRTQHGEAFKRLKREAKDASDLLAAQALRLERLLMGERTWPLAIWQQRYLNHPLTGTLARRLIWRFDETPAIFRAGQLVDADDHEVAPKENATVALWHPMRSEPAQVLAWRQWFERHEISQPFKQAHREIYVLTDAERQTASYSNRFAGHILHQHQFAALCQQRGWDYHVQGDFDSHNVPNLALAAPGLKAKFQVEGVENELSPRFIFLYVTTGQLRFGRPLADVPPAVFSEVMRDVDLFVGVSSVANDPTWRDRPERLPGQRTYWEDWSFGNLLESAKTRKVVIERLIPRLAAAERLSVSDKFLTVRGLLRNYKIHLGSANVLMEPNDQFLCVVAGHGAGTGQRLFLPFEGDTTLALILSKAFLLLADDKIADPTIARQIRS